MESNLKKCSRCKKNYDLEHYTKGTKILKKCLKCRNSHEKSRIKNKCPHGIVKYYCKICGGGGVCIHSKIKAECVDCGGSGVCHHNKLKSQCVDCGGSRICPHRRQKSNCVDCGGSSICPHNKIKNNCKLCSDPINLTIKKMIYHSKENDKKKNRYNPINFVNYNYLKNLISESNDRCCYCSCELQYIHFNHSLATLERLNNNVGHNIGNCAIACHRCNVSKVGNTINPQF